MNTQLSTISTPKLLQEMISRGSGNMKTFSLFQEAEKECVKNTVKILYKSVIKPFCDTKEKNYDMPGLSNKLYEWLKIDYIYHWDDFKVRAISEPKGIIAAFLKISETSLIQFLAEIEMEIKDYLEI